MPTDTAAGDPVLPDHDHDPRTRLLLALAAGIGFAILIAVIVFATGKSGDSSAAADAPRECLRAWNSDKDAITFARHNAIAHNYDEAQVGYMSATGSTEISDDPAGGECAVVFARTELDPEIEAAGEIQLEGGWTPLSARLDASDLAALQSKAFDGANARPTFEGTLEPL